MRKITFEKRTLNLKKAETAAKILYKRKKSENLDRKVEVFIESVACFNKKLKGGMEKLKAKNQETSYVVYCIISDRVRKKTAKVISMQNLSKAA
ncbi:MAG: hypothetical protein J0I41_23510 [Filimonas sp.]|nr:hypothetical protein [Filimonas sp.]